MRFLSTPLFFTVSLAPFVMAAPDRVAIPPGYPQNLVLLTKPYPPALASTAEQASRGGLELLWRVDKYPPAEREAERQRVEALKLKAKRVLAERAEALDRRKNSPEPKAPASEATLSQP